METYEEKEIFIEWQKGINDSKEISLLSVKEPSVLCTTMALFYSLKELEKNVNLLIEDFPENLKFLIPDLNFISFPKNFVLTIPTSKADISQIFYEKTPEDFKIFLTLQRGFINKADISLNVCDKKPDLIIKLGAKEHNLVLPGFSDSSSLKSPVIFIDGTTSNNSNTNENEIIIEKVFNLIKSFSHGFNKNSINCLTAAILCFTDNLKINLTTKILEILSVLVKEGSNINEIRKLMGFKN